MELSEEFDSYSVVHRHEQKDKKSCGLGTKMRRKLIVEIISDLFLVIKRTAVT